MVRGLVSNLWEELQKTDTVLQNLAVKIIQPYCGKSLPAADLKPGCLHLWNIPEALGAGCVLGDDSEQDLLKPGKHWAQLSEALIDRLQM